MRILAVTFLLTLLAFPGCRAGADSLPRGALEERALYADGPNGRYLLASGWSTRPDPDNLGLDAGWERPVRAGGFTPVASDPPSSKLRGVSRDG